MTNCKDRLAAVVECARRGAEPDVALKAHLAGCDSCAARWDSERVLGREFQAMRAQAMGKDRESQTRRDARAAALMVEFSRRRGPVMMPARAASLGSSVGWLAAAAALVAAAGIGYSVGMRSRDVAAEPVPGGVVYEAIADENFMALPYGLPAVPGELVSIVHADLDPEQLAGMGFDVDPALMSDGDIQADVVLGQDGFPRALRITQADGVSDF